MSERRIFYLSNDIDVPCGGVKVMYRHVDILNASGIPSFIVHKKRNFRCQWFKNQTPVVSWADMAMTSRDYLVVSEAHFASMSASLKGVPKVIFNQNCYYTFLQGYSLCPSEQVNYYDDRGIAAFLTVSKDSKNYLRYVFPDIPIMQVRNAIDRHIFSYSEQKREQVAFMTRKNIKDALQVINILKARRALGDFDIVPIENCNESEVARILKDSLFFLSFGYPEGFSLPPAEAMACGCVVVGYHGMAGREFMLPEFTYPIEVCAIQEYAQTVEEVLRLSQVDRALLDNKRRQASEYILKQYACARQERELVTFWKSLLM